MKTKKLTQLIRWIQKNQTEAIIVFSIIFLASFLRLYKLRQFVIFLGDEGRDALVVKRILFDHQLTLLGPTASVGGFYLGPIYYYFMIPFMLLFAMDPVGPAVMIALMGITTVILLYFLIRHWYGRFFAALASLLYSVSPGIVNFSRSSWNPNPMPLFTLLTIANLYFMAKSKKAIFALASGICFGIALQLHYLALLLGPILFATLLILTQPKTWFRLSLAQLTGFLIGASLYIAFEIKHGFPNVRSVFEFVTRGTTTGPRGFNLPLLFVEINRFTLESILGHSLQSITRPINLIFFLFLAIFFLLTFLKRQKLSLASRTIIIYWLLGTLGMGMYKGQLHYHYFEFLFPSVFLVFAMAISIYHSRIAKWFISTTIITFSLFLLSQQSIWGQGSNLIDQTKSVAAKVIQISQDKPFNFALITEGNSDHAYRFFLELAGSRPKALEEEVTQQLIVVCEKEIDQCQPLGHPLWEIAGFGRAEIDLVEEIQSNLIIFRLIHHPDSQHLIGKPATKG